MSVQRIARRYATALLKNAIAANQDETVERDLVTFLGIAQESADLRALLRSPVIENWRKKNILDEILKGRISDLTLGFFELTVMKGRMGHFREIISAFQDLYDAHRNMVRIEITSAVALDDASRDKVKTAVAKRTGKTVIPTYHVDPAVLGGVSVRIGDTVLDGTLRHQLADLREQLMTGSTPSPSLN